VEVDGNSGNISSNLHDKDELYSEFNNVLDGLECLILAHACAGINIISNEYRKGVYLTLKTISNKEFLNPKVCFQI